MLRKMLFVAAVLTVAGSAGCGDKTIPAVPFCADDVAPCAGSRAGARCALCADANSSLGCQFPGTGQLAVCVDSCDACDGGNGAVPVTATAPEALQTANVYVCSPLSWRESSWCAVCGDLDITLGTELCDSDGFCDPVVCVRTCDACQAVGS